MKNKRIKKTLEEIQSIAKKFSKRSDFAKQDRATYIAAKKLPNYEEIVSHMKPPATKAYTLEEIVEEAKKYTKIVDFKNKANGHYQAALKKSEYPSIVSHMEVSKTKPYTLEEIMKEAKKYTKRHKFKKENSAMYNAAWKRDDFEQIVSHMDKPTNKAYSLKEIQEEILKYDTLEEFYTKSPSIYGAATRKKDFDKIISNLKRKSGSSNSELNLFDLIKNIFPKTQKLIDRKVKLEEKPYIKSFEIDIYVPELRKGVEFDGRYYHSLEGLKRGHPTWPLEGIENYHEIKDSWFASKGIQILHIKEENWIKDKEACIKRCLEFLSK